MGRHIPEESPVAVLAASGTGMCQGRRGLGLVCSRVPPTPDRVEDGRTAAAERSVGESHHHVVRHRGRAGAGKNALRTWTPAFIKSHGSDTPERESSGSERHTRPAVA
jgi:hypothetical protein